MLMDTSRTIWLDWYCMLVRQSMVMRLSIEVARAHVHAHHAF